MDKQLRPSTGTEKIQGEAQALTGAGFLLGKVRKAFSFAFHAVDDTVSDSQPLRTPDTKESVNAPLFHRGDLLILRSRIVSPTGVLPVITVNGFHLVHENGGSEWKYDVTVDCGDLLVHDELISKRNLEDGFVKIEATGIEEARSAYRRH